jgi:hypothetical protein
MKRIFSLMLILAMLLAAVPSLPVTAQTAAPILSDKNKCEDPPSYGTYAEDGAGSNTCTWMPADGWNGDLVIYAHGYVDPRVDAGMIPWDQLTIDPATGFTLPQVLVGMKYAFAVTSYSKNGLAVKEGIDAVNQLAFLFKLQFPEGHVFLVGASEGGLVTAMAIEQNLGNLFSGGVTTCGPVGDFTRQVNYWGDFRVLFDYFFPGFKDDLGTPVEIKSTAITDWGTIESPGPLQVQIGQAIANNPGLAAQLISTGKAPIDPGNVKETIVETSLGLLDYNIKATNDGVATLGGQPFDNSPHWYFGSKNDWLLNLKVQRFNADSAAVAAMKNYPYRTTGKIKAPLVAMHTTGDPIVPYWHELLYLLKVWGSGKASQFFTIPIVGYGHCAFTPQEAIFAFAVMVYKATGTIPLGILSPQADNPYQVLTLDQYQSLMAETEKNQQVYGLSKVYMPMLNK